jgi:hypothetical protein
MDLVCDDSDKLTHNDPLMNAGPGSPALAVPSNHTRKGGRLMSTTLIFDCLTAKEASFHVEGEVDGDM